jgi:hypothetical protein
MGIIGRPDGRTEARRHGACVVTGWLFKGVPSAMRGGERP